MRSSFRTILLLYHVLSIWNFLILTCTIYILAPRFACADPVDVVGVGNSIRADLGLCQPAAFPDKV